MASHVRTNPVTLGGGAASATAGISYDDLYARWEQGNWSATAIDLTADRGHWHDTFSDLERRAALWNYSLFFWGEDAVTDGLSAYIDAAPREEQKYFLATQQVDEARHAVFFARFMREVVEVGGDSVGSALEAIRPQLTWGFNKVFGRLEKMSDDLRRDPSRPQLAAAITLYHLIIEASMAQPGQHFITSYLDERGILPGFRQGMHNVERDEQRHIGFGVKMLSDLVAEDPDCRYAVADLMREVMPWTAYVLVPPNWDRRYTECFGSTLEEIGAEGSLSLETKLRAAGLPLNELPGPPPMPIDLSHEERVVRGYDLVKMGMIGPGTSEPAPRDAESMALLFDTLRRSVDPRHDLPGPTTIQWEFPDAEPWHLRIDNGSSAAHPGRIEAPDVTLRLRYDHWVDVMGGRRDPRRLLATGRLRPSGNLRVLMKLPTLFPGRG